uniref:Coiled-coil domain-containing protein 137 n=1 Tax=Glossina brevipalpis TaxID=37001 RepID=A0A1A9W8P0_9MUSC
MARKRKIPVRKHHGVRDPLKQLEEKEKRLKNVVNNPPEKDNDQRPSYKFSQFKKLSDDAKAGKKFKRIHRGLEDKPRGNTKKKEVNKFKKIKQMPGEEDADYLRRVNRITSESLKEAQYAAKYGVQVIRNPKTGEISIEKKPPNEIDELLKQKQKRNVKGGRINKKVLTDNPKIIDLKIVKDLIKQAVQEDEMEANGEFQEYKKDIVKFGEVVHAPPTISTLPRKARKIDTVPRPGSKNNLLLQQILNRHGTNLADLKVSSKTRTTEKKSELSRSQLKGKRRDLPTATRNILESEQQKMISLYRDLKKSKARISG